MKAQAYAEGVLVDREVDAGVRQWAADARTRQVKDQKARERKEVRQAERSNGVLASKIWEDIRGKTIYLSNCTAAVKNLAMAHRMVSSAMHVADVFVAPSTPMKDVGQRIMLASRARGAYQVTQELVIKQGRSGIGM
eukprot:986240-Karenia_brevis.AAC.1